MMQSANAAAATMSLRCRLHQPHGDTGYALATVVLIIAGVIADTYPPARLCVQPIEAMRQE